MCLNNNVHSHTCASVCGVYGDIISEGGDRILLPGSTASFKV